jgi:hypothetical protein
MMQVSIGDAGRQRETARQRAPLLLVAVVIRNLAI